MAYVTHPTVGPYSPTQLTTDLNTNVTETQALVNALDTRLDAVEPQLVTLDSRLDAAEPQLVTLDSRIDAYDALNIPSNLLKSNRIINGCMRIDQRNSGASQTFTAGAALAYTVDRWYGYCTGANITGQRVALSNGQNRYRFTGAASNTAVGFGQRIEAANCLDLADGVASIQVKASSSSLTSLGWALYYANTTDTFGTLASPTRTLISSGTFTITSTEATYKVENLSIPSAAITGLEIVFTGGALLATQTLTLGDVQIERGATATTYERRLMQFEMNQCQRYFYRTVPSGLGGGGWGSMYTTTAGRIFIEHPVDMRVAPIITTTTTLSCEIVGVGSRSVGSFGNAQSSIRQSTYDALTIAAGGAVGRMIVLFGSTDLSSEL